MHVAYRERQETREGAGKDARAEEDGHAPLDLVALVVHAD